MAPDCSSSRRQPARQQDRTREARDLRRPTRPQPAASDRQTANARPRGAAQRLPRPARTGAAADSRPRQASPRLPAPRLPEPLTDRQRKWCSDTCQMHRAPSSLRSPTLRRAWAVRFDRRQRSGSGRLEASFVPPLCYPCSWLTGEEIRGRGVGIAVTGGWGCGAANRPPTATGARRANLANTGARRTHGPGDSERLSGATRPASGALAFTRHHQRAGRDGGLESNSGRRLSGPAAGLPIGGLTDAALAPGPTARW
jgi:hypothetical protein